MQVGSSKIQGAQAHTLIQKRLRPPWLRMTVSATSYFIPLPQISGARKIVDLLRFAAGAALEH